MSDTGAIDLLETSAAGGAAVRGGALRVIGYVVTAVIGAGSAAVVFRHLGVTGTGSYVTVLSIVAIVSGVSDLGMTTLGVRELSVRDSAGRTALMRAMLGMRIVVTLVGVGVGVAFAFLAGYRSPLVVGVAVAGAGLLAQSLQSTLSVGLMRDLRLGWVTVLEVGRQIALALIVIALALAGAGLIPIVAASIPVGLATLVATAVLLRGQVPLRPSFDRAQWVAMVRELLPFSIAIATAVLYFRVSVVIVSLVSSPRDLGYFSTSFRILEVLTQIPALMVGAAFPIFARAARDDHLRFAYGVERLFEVSVIVGVAFVLALAIGAPVAIDIIGGRSFHPAIDVLRVQAFALGGSFVGAVWSYALLSLRMQREMILISLGALSAGIVLVLALTLAAGPVGAAAATATTEIGLAIAGLVVLARHHAHLVPARRRIPRILAAGLGGAAVVLIPGLPAAAATCAALAVYAALLFILRAVPDEVAEELLRRRSPRPGVGS